ncbi:MAG: glycosyltransferase family 2 protein [Xenococcaceae cyanobacterium]
MNRVSNKFVSVIIPVFNDTERLKLCLAALENQTYPKNCYEVIVVDNNSEENIAALTKKFKQVILTKESKRGSYAARNRGIKIAKGEILGFTDSDCIPTSNWLENGVDRLLLSSNCGIVAGKIDLYYQEKNNPNPAEIFDKLVNLQQEKYVEEYHYGATANLFTFKQVFDKIGLFNAELKSGGDADWGNRVFAGGYDIIYATDVLVLHPARNSLTQLAKKVIRQTGGTFDREKKQKQNLKLSQIINYLIQLRPPVRSAIRKSLAARELNNILSKIKLTFIIIIIHYLRISEELRLELGGESRY